MKKRSSLVFGLLVALTLASSAGYLLGDGPSAQELIAWLKHMQTSAGIPPAPAPVAAKAIQPLKPLLAACRPKGLLFDACMAEGGYAVNTAWIDAHRKSADGRHAASLDYLQDKYVAGPSPSYGVPYWIVRPVKTKTSARP